MKRTYMYILISLLLLSFGVFAFIYLRDNITPCTSTSAGKKLPIIMYHHTSQKQKLLGKFTITSKEFEDDLIYLLENGFEAINVADLLAYVYDGATLPDKPVMITFDDGHESFYKYIYPLLKKYNVKAILSLVGTYTQTYSDVDDHNIDYSYTNWTQVNEMSKSGYVEIANHSYDMHKTKGSRYGISKNNNEDLEQYKKAISLDILKLQEDIKDYTGKMATTFTYPFGKFSKETKQILKDLGFKAIFNCAEKLNIIDLNNPNFLYNLGRFNRPSGIYSGDFFKKVLSEYNK